MKKRTFLKRILGFVLISSLLFTFLPAVGLASSVPNIIGTVTITNPYYVNVRAGGSVMDAVISQVQPGSVYPCVSIDTAGWYKILLDDGRTGYVSANITTFTPAGGGSQTVNPPNAYQVQIPIYYRDTYGNLLYTDHINLYTGSRLITPNNSLVPGYSLLGPANVVVSVSSGLSALPSSVTFLYSSQYTTPTPVTPPPVQQNKPANVQVNYIGPGGQTFYTTTLTLWQGMNYIQPQYNVVPSGYVLSSSSNVQVSVSSNGYATPASVVFIFRQGGQPTAAPTTRPTQAPSQGGYLPDFVKTRPNSGSYPVYTGPGEWYYRVGNATLGGGVIRVYGQENGWVLIGYGLSNGGYRIGFVSMSAIPADIYPQPLELNYSPKNNVSASLFVDDPIVSKNRELIKRYEGGSPFYFLAYLNDFWAYVEIENFEGSGQPARGFVSRRSLGV